MVGKLFDVDFQDDECSEEPQFGVPHITRTNRKGGGSALVSEYLLGQ